MLTWRLSRAKGKDIEVHVVLLEDAIVLLQRQDERLVLRFQTKEDRSVNHYPHSPIIQLATMLTRGVANGWLHSVDQFITPQKSRKNIQIWFQTARIGSAT